MKVIDQQSVMEFEQAREQAEPEIARLTGSAARHLFNAWVQDSQDRRTELGRLEGQLSMLLEDQGAEKLYEQVFETVAEIEQHVFILAFEAGRRFAAGK